MTFAEYVYYCFDEDLHVLSKGEVNNWLVLELGFGTERW